MKRALILGLLGVFAVQLAGCTGAQDRMVERHMSNLESDLRVRGTLERTSIEKQFETFRKAKHAEIDQAYSGALDALEQFGKLNAGSARKAADRFGGMHRELDRLVNEAKAQALAQTEWYTLAADTVRGEQQYQQAKSTAMLEGGKAFLESFGASYVTANGNTPEANADQAGTLMNQLTGQLRDLLAARIATAN